MSTPKVLFGFHAVGVRLKTAPQSIIEIYYEPTRRDARMRQFLQRAQEAGVRLIESDGARVAKLCGNHLVSAILASLGESLAMAKKSGLDCTELIKLWGESDFRSPIIEGAGHSMLNHDFAVSFHLRTMVKDTELIRNYSESIGVPVMLSNQVHELNKVAQNMGWGEENASAIFKVFEVMAGMAPEAGAAKSAV